MRRTLLTLLLAACATPPPPEAPPPPPPPAPPPPVVVAPPPAPRFLSPWTSNDAMRRLCEEVTQRIDGYRAQIVAPGPRTTKTVLEPYNLLLVELDRSVGLSELMANVHPEAAVRLAGEECERTLKQRYNILNQDKELYAAIAAVDKSTLDAQGQRFVDRSLLLFRRSGVDRDDPTRAELQKLYEEMVATGQEFQKALRDGVRNIQVDPKDLKGLPEDFIKAHPVDAAGKITLDINYPDFFPVQNYAENEKVRQQLYVEFLNRGYPANDAHLAKLLLLRKQYSSLLGYESWAAYQAEDKMAKNAATIDAFIAQVAKIVRPKVEKESKLLLARKRKDDKKAKAIYDWDRFFYVEKVKQEQFGFDARQVRPYFEFNRVTEGLMSLYGELFGVRFERDTGTVAWHPSVQVWEMLLGDKLLGRIYLDMHPRENKYSHAAMFPMRTGRADGTLAEAALVCNFADPSKTSPALMEHSQVVTYFHEFGHLVHQLLANGSDWVALAGIAVEHDFVEAPSQLLEEWAWDPAVLARFAKHVETNEPIPAALVEKMKASTEFGKGLNVMRQVSLAALSFYIHTTKPEGLDLLAFNKKIFSQYSPFPWPEGSHFYASFGHLDGYSSQYYTYQWSLSLAKDIFTRFQKEGLLNVSVAQSYRDTILKPGGTKDAAVLVQDFLGRPFNLDAYRAWLLQE